MNKNIGLKVSYICNFALILCSLLFHSIAHSKDLKALNIDTNTIALWHMDSIHNNAGYYQVYDETGNFNLQQTRNEQSLKLVYSVGGSGKSITGFSNYTGALDLVDAIHAGLPDSTSQTFEAWIKWDNDSLLPKHRASKKQTVMARLVGSTSSAWLYFINNQIKLSIRSGDGRRDEKIYTAVVNPRSGIWYHVAFTIEVNDFDQQGDKNDTQVKLYFNDVNNTDSTPEPLSDITTTSKGVVYEDFEYRANGWLFRLGKRYGISNAEFRGLIDEVRLSDIAKTTFDVFESTANNEPIPVEVPFIPSVSVEEKIVPVIPAPVVSKPTNPVEKSTLTGSSTSCGKGIELDGIHDWINIPNLTFASDFTIESWVKLAPGIDNKDALFGQEGPGPDINFYRGKVRLYSHGDKVTANTALSPGIWEHIAITRLGTNLKLYINGEEDAIGTWNGVLSLKAIGRGNKGFIKGMLDEIRVWNIARTGAEISANYDTNVDPNALGLIGYWNFNETKQIITDASNSVNHGSLGASSAVGADDPVRLDSMAPFTENCDDESTEGNQNKEPTPVEVPFIPSVPVEKPVLTNKAPVANDDKVNSVEAGGTISFTVTDNDEDSDDNLNPVSVVIVSAPDNGIASVNASGTITYSNIRSTATADTLTYTVADRKGAISNEASIFITINSVSSCGKGIEFDGINDWINIPDLTLAGDFTVEGWIKLAHGIDNKDALFGQEGFGPDINFSRGGVRLYADRKDQLISNTQLLPDSWEHIAITRSGNALTLYLNGKKDATGTWGGSLSLKAIGRGNRGYLKGILDEIRVWDIALTGTEITNNFNTDVNPNVSGLIGYWNFNETGQIVADTSNSENHGSLGASRAVGGADPVRTDSIAPLTENCEESSTVENPNEANPIQAREIIRKYTIGGSVSGLAGGNKIVLKNNGGNSIAINENGVFNFSTALDNNSNYLVSIDSQPTIQDQTCSLGSEVGKLSGSNITNVKVVCVNIDNSALAQGRTPAGNDYKVTFEPPVMINPEVIDLSEVKPIKWPAYGLICSGLIINVSLNKDEDYIIMMSGNTPLKYPVRVAGGRNVRIVGLDIRPIVQPGCEIGRLPVNLRPSGQRKNANYHPRMPLGMAVQMIQTHTSFVEGVFIDLNGIEADCFVARNFGGLPNVLAREQRDIVIQNTACWGGESQQYTVANGDGLHGDFFQNQGEVMRNFVIENSTQHSSSHSLVQHSWGGYSAAVKNVIKRYDYSEDQRFAHDDVGDIGGMGYIMDGNADNWIIEDVYGEGQSVIQNMIVKRPPNGPVEQYSYTNINALIHEDSSIHKGKPANGHFAKKANIGLNYVSPHKD